jgi:hypothetical protein
MRFGNCMIWIQYIHGWFKNQFFDGTIFLSSGKIPPWSGSLTPPSTSSIRSLRACIKELGSAENLGLASWATTTGEAARAGKKGPAGIDGPRHQFEGLFII